MALKLLFFFFFFFEFKYFIFIYINNFLLNIHNIIIINIYNNKFKIFKKLYIIFLFIFYLFYYFFLKKFYIFFYDSIILRISIDI